MDYSRFGRQIALSDLGVSGQEAIAAARVYFYGPPSAVEFADLCWKNSGGTTVTDAAAATLALAVGTQFSLSLPSASEPISDVGLDPIDALAFGAAAACEAAQRVLTSDSSSVSDFSAQVATALMDRDSTGLSARR